MVAAQLIAVVQLLIDPSWRARDVGSIVDKCCRNRVHLTLILPGYMFNCDSKLVSTSSKPPRSLPASFTESSSSSSADSSAVSWVTPINSVFESLISRVTSAFRSFSGFQSTPPALRRSEPLEILPTSPATQPPPPRNSPPPPAKEWNLQQPFKSNQRWTEASRPVTEATSLSVAPLVPSSLSTQQSRFQHTNGSSSLAPASSAVDSASRAPASKPSSVQKGFRGSKQKLLGPYRLLLQGAPLKKDFFGQFRVPTEHTIVRQSLSSMASPAATTSPAASTPFGTPSSATSTMSAVQPQRKNSPPATIVISDSEEQLEEQPASPRPLQSAVPDRSAPLQGSAGQAWSPAILASSTPRAEKSPLAAAKGWLTETKEEEVVEVPEEEDDEEESEDEPGEEDDESEDDLVAGRGQAEEDSIVVLDSSEDEDEEAEIQLQRSEKAVTVAESAEKTAAAAASAPDDEFDLGGWVNRYKSELKDRQKQQEARRLEQQAEAAAQRNKAYQESQRLSRELQEKMSLSAAPDPAPPLPPEAASMVEKAWRAGDPGEVLISTPTSLYSYEFKRHDAQTMQKLNWLNDCCINAYFNLLAQRSDRDRSLPRIWVFNSFFYSSLKDRGYDSVKSWTRRAKNAEGQGNRALDFDKILLPLHVSGNHWCCGCIDFKRKRIEYYDSFQSGPGSFFEVMRDWLKKESETKYSKPFDFTGWSDYYPSKVPRQHNSSDCGVFTTQFAERLSRDAAFNFEQKHMQYMRRRVLYEILKGDLWDASRISD